MPANGERKPPRRRTIGSWRRCEPKQAERLYEALDLPTRWSWMTIRRTHREAYDILLSNLPEGRERDQATRRFEAGALSEDDAALFAEELSGNRWRELGELIGSAARPPGLPRSGPTSRRRRGQAAARCGFVGDPTGAGGLPGWPRRPRSKKRRAVVDLETIRNNAADQERAASRAGR